MRAHNLQEKTAEIDKVLGSHDLKTLFKDSSLPYNEKALGLESLRDSFALHPLVWAINQTGMDLSIALSAIWDEPNPDVAPVEYLPLVSNKSYFSKPRAASQKYLSKLILDTYNTLRK